MPRRETKIDPERMIMIKVKTCQRLLREVQHYKKEVTENEEKVKGMVANEADPYDIKRFRQILDESYMMVPDSTRRLESAFEDLIKFLEGDECEFIPNENEWLIIATKMVKEHTAADGEDDHIATTTNVDHLVEGEAF